MAWVLCALVASTAQAEVKSAALRSAPPAQAKRWRARSTARRRFARPRRVITPRRRMRRTLARADHRMGIRQLTGRDLRVGQTEFAVRAPADPSVYQLPDGRVQLWGTFETYFEYDSLDDLLRGAAPRVMPVPAAPESAWDRMIHRWPDGREVLYAGTMTAPGGDRPAEWPADNWTRRIYPYTRGADGRWVRGERPLFNPVSDGMQPTMIGHAYGHHFKTVTRRVGDREVSETWLIHEEIVGEQPTRTEIFARRMIDPFTASAEKVKLVGVEYEGRPVGKRLGGDLLVEGARPFEVELAGETYHFLSFSAGDFSSDNYDINFAWRRGDPIGPYQPYVARGAGGEVELRGFGEAIKRRYQLSWLGRAHVVRDGRGELWAVFHAVDKTIRPELDYSKNRSEEGLSRNVYAVPLAVRLGADGAPVIELLDRPRSPLGMTRARRDRRGAAR